MGWNTIAAARTSAAAFLVQARAFQLLLICRKAGFRPDQARAPAGTPEGGQWVDEDQSRSKDLPLLPVSHSDDGAPKIPKERPPTVRERNSFAVAVARTLHLAIRVSPPAWIWDHARDRIHAYLEPAKSLEELKEAALDPRPGYEIHHIVEQTSARQDGWPREKIEGYDNRVRVPTYRHWQITAWYARKNERFNGMSPREFLRGQRWELRYSIGLYALRLHGVLKP